MQDSEKQYTWGRVRGTSTFSAVIDGVAGQTLILEKGTYLKGYISRKPNGDVLFNFAHQYAAKGEYQLLISWGVDDWSEIELLTPLEQLAAELV